MRAAIFIDGGYILSQLKQHKIKPNFAGFSEYFLRPLRQSVQLDLLRVYFYYCAPWMSDDPTEDEERRMEAYQDFIAEIESQPRWEVRLGKLEKRWDRNREYFEQKRVDVLLSVDMVRHAAAGHIQHAILVAGDSDFIPAVQATKESGVTVTLWAGDENTVHDDLSGLADDFHNIFWKKFPSLGKTSSTSTHLRKKHKKHIPSSATATSTSISNKKVSHKVANYRPRAKLPPAKPNPKVGIANRITSGIREFLK